MQTGDIANAAWLIALGYGRSAQSLGRCIRDVVLSEGLGIKPEDAHQFLLIRMAQTLQGTGYLRRRKPVDFLPKLLARDRQIELGRTGIPVRDPTFDKATRLQPCNLSTGV